MALIAVASYTMASPSRAQAPAPVPAVPVPAGTGTAAPDGNASGARLPAAGDQACGKPIDDPSERTNIAKLTSINGKLGEEGTIPTVKLGDRIELEVVNLKTWQDWARCVKDGGSVVVFIDGRPLPGGIANPPLAPGGGKISFVLERTTASQKLWTQLLGEPVPGGAATRPVLVSIGLERLYPIESKTKIVIDPLPGDRLVVWVGLLALILFMLFFRVGPGEALRDDGIAPLQGGRPYSLARVGAAGWFVVLLTSYLFISVATLDFMSSFTGVPAVIAAIAAGTVGFSSAIDASKDQPANTQDLRSFITQCDALLLALRIGTAPLPAPPAPPAGGWRGKLGDLQARYATIVASPTNTSTKISEVEELRDAPLRSKGFLNDIISDADGIAFHRYQFFAWTLVLMIVFLYLVWKDLAMPEYNAALLALMGISSGTYLGMKIPEPTVAGTK